AMKRQDHVLVHPALEDLFQLEEEELFGGYVDPLIADQASAKLEAAKYKTTVISTPSASSRSEQQDA
ncbi:hypothetical protein LTR16_011977, partial [Cryomyces antarcticus]